ncbi:FbpB family small basic protein [Bacillaceae bacterium IKA-2]|nr:FbpB family small basic protein [Bacillaceae bacterium IKA-2]
MRRIYSKSFEELVEENKLELMNNPAEIKKLEIKLEKKQLNYSKKN